ncbi:MAG TPA: DUF3472 domain-containing protein [Pyrinomonadaceae bacterium]|nr:DUF3472 domain-containing protein [Pyrinomonadaceae bacterium]
MKNAVILFAVILFFTSGIFAQQQQYANAYAYWDFGDSVNDVSNVDQKIWVVRQAPSSQWVMMWSWTADPAHGGYFGFNTDDEGKAQALFSLWNADNATGGSCKEFGGEGEGWSCRMPFDLRSDAEYKLRLARTKTDGEGVWWGGWIYQETGSGAPAEIYLGEIRVKKEMDRIRGNSIMNFSEYFGEVVEKCSSVPFSIFAVAPPAANREAKTGKYQHPSKRNGSTDPKSNPCQTGNEPQGNLLKVEDINFAGAASAVIFLGGTRNDHVMPKGMSTPLPQPGVKPAAPSVSQLDDIINKHIDALGGREKLLSLKTVRKTGAYTVQGVDVASTLTISHMIGSRTDLNVLGTANYQIVTPTKGINFMPVQGVNEPEELNANELKAGQPGLDIQGPLLDHHAKGTSVELLGTEKVDGEDNFKLKLTFKNGVVNTYFMSTKTYLITKTLRRVTINGEPTDVGTTYSNYKRNADGYLFPYTLTVVSSETNYDKIETNIAVDPSIFK